MRSSVPQQEHLSKYDLRVRKSNHILSSGVRVQDFCVAKLKSWLACLTACCFVGRTQTDERLDQRPYINVTINGKVIPFLVDCGATKTIMSQQIFKRIFGWEKFAKLPDNPHLRVRGVSGSILPVFGVLFSLCLYNWRRDSL